MHIRTLALAAGASLLLAAPVSQAKSSSAGDVATRGAVAAASQGPTQLRRYIQRTRMVYGLSYWDFAKAE